MHLPADSISSWSDLCHEFVGAFTGGHQAHGQLSDLHIIPQKESENLRKYIQRFSRVQYNTPDVHPAAVISAFHQNMRNCKMREELAVTKVKDVAELYVLADRCARAEEGSKYPGKDVGVEIDSMDDTVTPANKARCHNRKHKVKAVLAIEVSDDTDATKKTKEGNPGKEVGGCVACRALAAAD